ncbi:Berberine bridge enzyme-like 17 [Bienertia sinuspersici]
MKGQYSYLITSILLPFLFLLWASHISASNSTIDSFVQCLQSHSNQSHPISNAIFTPSNSSFLNVLYSYIRDSRFNTSSTPKPLAIVTALDATHVQATVICAKKSGIQIRIRSGGHDFEGLSYVSSVPFVILDMFNLRSIDIDMQSETAWIDGGATIGELYYKIAQKSRVHAFPAGVCFTLGAGGHFSGGGYGNMLREYGLSIDHIIDAHVVDANGRLLNRETMGEDLFWAIRGGGAASFCVIISWKIKLVRVPEKVTVFNVPKTLEQGATDVVLQWQDIASTIDRKLFIRVQPQTIQTFPRLGLQAQDCTEMPWIKTTLFWNGDSMGTPLEVLLDRTPTPSHSYGKHKSDYVKKPIPRAGLETIWKKMIELQADVFLMQWNPYGGKMSEISSNATAFPHRAGNLFKMQYLALWQDDSIEATYRNIQATRELHATFTPYVSSNPREAFLNYRDIDIGTNENGNLVFASDLYKDNVKRLLQVKAKVDPSNFFRYEQSIPLFPRAMKQ